jgi:hypothetical protein
MKLFMIVLGIFLLAGHLAFFAWLLRRILKSNVFGRSQQWTQATFALLVPIAGPAFIWMLRKSVDAPHDPGDPDWTPNTRIHPYVRGAWRR